MSMTEVSQQRLFDNDPSVSGTPPRRGHRNESKPPLQSSDAIRFPTETEVAERTFQRRARELAQELRKLEREYDAAPNKSTLYGKLSEVHEKLRMLGALDLDDLRPGPWNNGVYIGGEMLSTVGDNFVGSFVYYYEELLDPVARGICKTIDEAREQHRKEVREMCRQAKNE